MQAVPGVADTTDTGYCVLPICTLGGLPLPEAIQVNIPAIPGETETTVPQVVDNLEACYDAERHGNAMRRRSYLIDPLHLQGATRGSSSLPVSQQILHRHAGLTIVSCTIIPKAFGNIHRSSPAHVHTGYTLMTLNVILRLGHRQSSQPGPEQMQSHSCATLTCFSGHRRTVPDSPGV